MRLFGNLPRIFVKQHKEWAEILVRFETRNKYVMMDEAKNELGQVVERGGGLLHVLRRLVLQSHRPLEIDVLDRDGSVVLRLSRSFFWFFSELNILSGEGERLGSVHRRWALLSRRYELRDNLSVVFADIVSRFWRIWTFPVIGRDRMGKAEITKRWGGLLREYFTDADTFCVDFGDFDWGTEQRAVIFAAAIAIDFDFFENNNQRRSIGYQSG
jgi:uncharacterized protein YxjI